MEAAKFLILIFGLLLRVLIPGSPPREWWQYKDAREAGWSAELLEKARQKAEEMGSTAVMLLFRGQVLAAWGDISRRCPIHSLRKSLVATLVGIHAAAGRIDPERSMADLGIDDLQSLTPEEKRATVRDLLRCRSGIYHPAAKETREMKKLRPVRGSHAAGEFWYYNNWDNNVLGAILEQGAGMKIADDFQQKLAQPLGMEDFRRQDTFYQFERHLSRYPACTFRLSARDLARFGQLYLNRGSWMGQEVIPSGWVDESWTPYTEVRPGTFFGYSWWIYPKKSINVSRTYPRLYKQDRYGAWGLGGQLVLMVPAAQLVLVHLADTDSGLLISGKKIWELAEMILAARTENHPTTHLLEPLTPLPFKNARPAASEHREIKLAPLALREYVGIYQLAERRHIQLRSGDGILIAALDGREIDFFPGASSYFFARAENMQIAFHRDRNSRVSGLSLITRGKPQKARKSFTP